MAQIPLTQGLCAVIDDADLPLVSGRNWHAVAAGSPIGKFYAARGEWTGGRMRRVYMHRLIAEAKQGEQVDHINADGLDNRRCNLRLATQSQNNANSAPWKAPASGYRGVYKERRRWAAAISVCGQMVRLGSFLCPIEAARAYDAAAKSHYGEFARLNFPT